ncbi:LacI family DNA-binding transcriptional regulator [Poseidonocella sedimentorum]|uniref:Transcriptional regulator, LacI family n=1 Tax=Poseidonocella sedimentorum TaxID=871652 RepID=A0A1I6CX65_9RHOB|nr:LacI family DNA-binding transcriptional regulator [Poseidonocella sedimentorum]SFQ97742.1 transcriptional regulator, LacI family [Poseidonocella sedimentorum]
MEGKKNASIRDVARVAGVSTATVSRALSNPDILSERTRESVIAAIRETGYRVNRAARNLRTRRAGAVLVLVPNLGNPFFSHILAAISARFQNSGYSVLITDSRDPAAAGHDYLDYFMDGRIDGMICLDGGLDPGVLARFRASQFADRIVFACEWSPEPSFASVRSDNRAGAALAVRHLHGLGHRRIAHVKGPADNVLTEARRAGMAAECAALGLDLPPEWIIAGEFSLEAGRAAAAALLELPNRPSAVFCASDMVAFGLISELTERGLRVPEDMSVMGFDDVEIAAYCQPPLTTIRQDRRQLGLRAAELLQERLDRAGAPSDAPGEIALVGTELVVRRSTAAPR